MLGWGLSIRRVASGCVNNYTHVTRLIHFCKLHNSLGLQTCLRCSLSSVRSHVGGIDLDADALTDQVDAQHESRARALAHQPADDAAQRPPLHFNEHAFMNERARVVAQLARDERAQTLDLSVGNRRGLSLEADEAHDARALDDGE